MNYEILLAFHYPHDRFALGWEYIAPDKECKYHTITLYLFILTINFNYETD
jgi:hypothetical protein